MKIGGTNSKGNYLEMIIVAHLCAHPYLHGEGMVHIWNFMIAPAMQGEYSNDSLPDEELDVQRVKTSAGV